MKKSTWMPFFCIGCIIAGLYILYMYLQYRNEHFENITREPIPAKKIPPIDPAVVDNIKKTIRQAISEKPEVIQAVKEILADPDINPTFHEIMTTGSKDDAPAEKSSFSF